MTSRQRALVVLNPAAHGGTAARRFEAVRPIVDSLFDARVVAAAPGIDWRGEVFAALCGGVRAFISAGGDGTAHALLNALAAAPHRPRLEEIALGAIGLGSSNDLHKPVRRHAGGIPLLLDLDNARPRDVVRCDYADASGSHTAYVLISASVGLVACANARFSESTWCLLRMRRISTTAAIAWAAARTVAGWRNLDAQLRIDGGVSERMALSNLSVLKTEWLSGGLRFEHPVEPASGDFEVAIAEGLGRARLLADMLALLRGRFDLRAGHRRCRARSLEVRLREEAPLEFDGEVARAREASFDMFPERIRLCSP